LIELTILNPVYSQNFNTLGAGANTLYPSSSLPAGWYMGETGNNANITYRGGTGSLGTGDTYSFGSDSTDRALGGLQSGTLIPTIGASFANKSGGTINSFAVAYIGEMWRVGTASRTDKLDYQYSLNATSLSDGIWVDVDTLDFNSFASATSGALIGNDAANRTAVNGTMDNLSLLPDQTIWIRWTDFNASGADDGMAIDDFSIAPQGTAGATVVNLSVSSNAGSETGTTVITVTATRSAAVAGDQTVDLAVGGTGITAGDYILSGTTITIPDGGNTGSITFTILDDDLIEGLETALLSIANPSAGIVLGSAVSQSVAITDDDAALVRISAIQGGGAVSTLQGQLVKVEAIVVGDFQGSNGLTGFFLQEEDADQDGDANTSEGIFVYQGADTTPLEVGDKVWVTGVVSEYKTGTSSLTQLTDLRAGGIISTDQVLPTAVELSFPLVSAASLEAFEGMRVSVNTTLTVSDTFTLGRFGELLLSSDGPGNQPGTDARLDTFTQFNEPSVANLAAYQDQIAVRRIVLDDGSSTQNNDPILYGRDGNPMTAANTLRGGDTTSHIVGVLDERFGASDTGNYRIQPTQSVDFAASNTREATAPGVGGTLRVASFNVLNFFNGDGNGGGFPTSRGADTTQEFDRQVAKTVSAIIGLNADVLGLIEIENDGFGPTSAIQALVNAVNAIAGAGTYAFVNPGLPKIGSDAITVGMIYKPGSVALKGSAGILDNSFVDPDGGGFDSSVQRPSLAQSFEVNATGAVFTPVINHLKSKGSSALGASDADAGDGQGFSNGTRTRAADTLADWLATDPTGSNDPDFLILGDLNAYAMEDPVRTLKAGADNVAGTADDYVNLLGERAYSYSFDGQWGSLDHALATLNLQSQVTGAADWHINADEPTVLDYNTEFKTAGHIASLYDTSAFRSSDHDPVVVGLNLGFTNPGTNGNDIVVGSSGNDKLSGGIGRDNINGGAGNDVINGGSGRDMLAGGTGADTFVYTSVLDAGDTITDFAPGQDRLDIATLLRSVGYFGNNPVADGFLQTQIRLTSTSVMFDSDGFAGGGVPRVLVALTGVAISDAQGLLDPTVAAV